jgi:hypothetical protein
VKVTVIAQALPGASSHRSGATPKSPAAEIRRTVARPEVGASVKDRVAPVPTRCFPKSMATGSALTGATAGVAPSADGLAGSCAPPAPGAQAIHTQAANVTSHRVFCVTVR